MARALATLIGIIGLVGAAYLFLHRATEVIPGFGNDSHLDAALFGTVVAVLSIMLLVASRSRREPGAGDSISM